MIDYVRTILTGQFEAALCMLNESVASCPPEHWTGRIGNNTFQQVAYHTLFFTDLYLSPGEAGFQLRDLHGRGGDERTSKGFSPGLPQDETLAYAATCHAKVLETLAAETPDSLAREAGFSWLSLSRGEVHLYNMRHVAHHTGQLSSYLRRILGDGGRWWVRTGWRASR